MVAAAVRLKWHQTFLFLFQAILSIADTATDVLTSLSYREEHEQWFAVSLGLTLITMAVLCIWSIIASTSRVLSKEEDAEETNPDVIFRNTRVNVLLGCLCVGPPLHSFQMFLVCASRFKELWKSDNGLRIEKYRLYYLYVHTLNLKMVEGLLESAPQLIIQVYVMLKLKESRNIQLIQMISAPISFLSLTWMITSMEAFRQFANYDMKLLHNLMIFLSNVGIIAARTLAIICFTIAFPWWIFIVFGVHWFIINAIGFVLWRSKRKQDILIFVVAYSPLYLFIYSSYYLKKLKGNAPFGLGCRLCVTVTWHVLFTVENIAMILGFYFYSPDELRWFAVPALAVVIIGNLGGILLKSLSWYCCFAEEDEEYITVQRPETIRVQTMNRA